MPSSYPRLSVVSESDSIAPERVPQSPEMLLREALDEYVKTAPQEEADLLMQKGTRGRVLEKLKDFSTLLPVLGRVSRVADAQARRMGIKEEISFRRALVFDRVAAACREVCLEDLTKIDPLTGIANRRGYEESAKQVIELSARTGLPLWCYMVDVDHFRLVNGGYGHLAGDQVLKEIASRLSDSVRRSDTIARFGGEEFILLSLLENEKGAEVLGQRLLEAVGSKPFRVETEEKGVKMLKVTVSIGGSRYRFDEENERRGMESRADRSLYQAKNGGRNRIYLEGKLMEQETLNLVRRD